MALQKPRGNSSAIVVKSDYEIAITSASDRVFDNWHDHLFRVAKSYNRIPADADKEKWTEKKLTTLFSSNEMATAHDVAITVVLGDIEAAAGKALLYKMWNIYQSGQWITFRPSTRSNDDSWTFGDFVSAGSMDVKSENYRRKLAFVCERIFDWLTINTIGDENGERIDPLYLIKSCGPYMLIEISQRIFSKEPTTDVIRNALLAILSSDTPDDEIMHQANRIDRVINGLEGNFYYVRQQPDGTCVFHIVLKESKHIKKLTKQLDKMGEMRLWAETNIQEPPVITEEESV